MTDIAHTIQNLYEQIFTECQRYLYYPFGEEHKCSQRIYNAVIILYTDAVIVIRKKLNKAPRCNLTLEEICQVYKKILKVLLQYESAAQQEHYVRKILVETGLNPKNFLFIEPWLNRHA